VACFPITQVIVAFGWGPWPTAHTVLVHPLLLPEVISGRPFERRPLSQLATLFGTAFVNAMLSGGSSIVSNHPFLVASTATSGS
jgi:hypothetical protein